MALLSTNHNELHPDGGLIERIATGDRDALRELYEQYRQPLGSFLHRRLYSQKLVDEAFNDVMYTVWRKAAEFRGDSKVSTWIYGIAYRVALSAARKEIKHDTNRADSGPEDLNIAEATVEQDDRVDELKEAVSRLKDNHRIVIELAYFNEKSLDEIASILDIPTNTVKTRLFHARKYLKGIMTELLQQRGH